MTCNVLVELADHAHELPSLLAPPAPRAATSPHVKPKRYLSPSCRMLGMSVRALSFGAIAEAYERFRPGYPKELVDLVVMYAGQPVRTALEIGAGTGKATRLFAEHGVTVTATEPDAAMLTELRKTVPANVRTIRAAFE